MVDSAEFLTYVSTLINEGYLRDPRELVFIEDGSACFVDDENLDSEFGTDRIATLPVGEFRGKTQRLTALESVVKLVKGPSAFMVSRAPYTLAAANAGQTIYPYLDDFAQLLGRRVDVIDKVSQTKSLRKKNALLMRDIGGLCRASNLYDLHAAAMVLEKGCQARINSWFLGGGRKISFLDASLMRIIYLKKYSKEASRA